MINIQTSKQLNILVASTNKALEHVLKDATAKDLQGMSTPSKDLKSIMDDILKQSSQNSSSNKTLLDLVKNNPTLKSLGEPSQTIKELIATIKNDKNPLPIEKVLKDVLVDIKDIKTVDIKNKLENSGVFLESKLKNIQNPQVELKNNLTILKDILQDSKLPIAKDVTKQITELLKSEPLKSATNADVAKDIQQSPKVISKIASDVTKILQNLQTTLKQTDTLYSQKTQSLVQQLVQLISSGGDVKSTLNELRAQLDKSLTLESKTVLKSLDKVLMSLGEGENKNVTSLAKELNQTMQKTDSFYSKDVITLFNKLKNLSLPNNLGTQNNVKEMIATDLKATLIQTTQELQNSSNPNKNELIKQMDKLVLQIDNYQLISHLSSGSSIYLPISWDQLEGGNIEIKKQNEKFYCDINLKLKDYGEVDLKLTLYEKNQLNLHIYSPNKEFKEQFQGKISELRSALIETQITPREIRFHEKTTNIVQNPYEDNNFKMGFEVKA